jgi:hypothetical protein
MEPKENQMLTPSRKAAKGGRKQETESGTEVSPTGTIGLKDVRTIGPGKIRKQKFGNLK